MRLLLSFRSLCPFGALLACLSALLGCGSESATAPRSEQSTATAEANSEPALVELELALNWYPEAEHGGFYAALLDGEFKSRGLSVKITPGGKSVPVIQNVATGRVPFAVANADQVLIGRAADADVIAIFAPIQTSPRCVMVHAKSGIQKFEELKNLKLAVNPSPFASVLKKKVPLEGCSLVAYEGQVTQFLLDEKYAQQGYVFSEPFVAKQNGGDPHTLMAAEIGFNPYTSVLITSSKQIKERPDVVRRLVAACQAGWVKYLAEPAKTNEHIHAQNPEMPLDALAFGVEALKPLCLTEGINAENFGSMTLDRWEALTKTLEECEVLDAGAVSASSAFSTEFLP